MRTNDVLTTWKWLDVVVLCLQGYPAGQAHCDLSEVEHRQFQLALVLTGTRSRRLFRYLLSEPAKLGPPAVICIWMLLIMLFPVLGLFDQSFYQYSLVAVRLMIAPDVLFVRTRTYRPKTSGAN